MNSSNPTSPASASARSKNVAGSAIAKAYSSASVSASTYSLGSPSWAFLSTASRKLRQPTSSPRSRTLPPHPLTATSSPRAKPDGRTNTSSYGCLWPILTLRMWMTSRSARRNGQGRGRSSHDLVPQRFPKDNRSSNRELVCRNLFFLQNSISFIPDKQTRNRVFPNGHLSSREGGFLRELWKFLLFLLKKGLVILFISRYSVDTPWIEPTPSSWRSISFRPSFIKLHYFRLKLC